MFLPSSPVGQPLSAWHRGQSTFSATPVQFSGTSEPSVIGSFLSVMPTQPHQDRANQINAIVKDGDQYAPIDGRYLLHLLDEASPAPGWMKWAKGITHLEPIITAKQFFKALGKLDTVDRNFTLFSALDEGAVRFRARTMIEYDDRAFRPMESPSKAMAAEFKHLLQAGYVTSGYILNTPYSPWGGPLIDPEAKAGASLIAYQVTPAGRQWYQDGPLFPHGTLKEDQLQFQPLTY